MERIESAFREMFSHWDVPFPRDAEQGMIQHGGWTIRYRFGSGESGIFMDLYASHRMTNDRHMRIHEDGRVEGMPAYQTTMFYRKGASEEEKEEARRALAEANERARESLQDKFGGSEW